MLEINERNRVFGEEIHKSIESKNNNYRQWLNDKLEYADLQEGKDFFTILLKSSGGRPKTQYEFTLDAAKEICLLERNEKAKNIRRWLIDLSNKKDNLELITVKQAAFAVKVINCLKYIENQKEALSLHKSTYLADRNVNDNKYIYAEFAKYRSNIVGWDKAKTDEALNKFLLENPSYSNKLKHSDMQTKLSVIDTGEAIRIAVLDILYAKHESENMAVNFANMCKRLSKEMEIKPEKNNTENLFRVKENISKVKELTK
jgi:phage anti-repressor protein